MIKSITILGTGMMGKQLAAFFAQFPFGGYLGQGQFFAEFARG
ncbi:hypothetical protein SDE12394_08345 [Streptococcus dysgalactiae subsp. equisimilis ATCC 12394]|nr:hypothetical protein SDE12394_08345 [Streptococcus dysgalactiae subsp. equisimilis ATCC 12394]